MAKGIGKFHYYSPRPLDLTVPGIRLSERADWDWKDYWTGSMESLVSAGFATEDMFPGQPGRPSIAVSYRPVGGRTDNDAYWHFVPGFIRIHRLINGSFSIQITVSREEQRLRRDRSLSRARLATPTTAVPVPIKPLQRAHPRLVWSAPQ